MKYHFIILLIIILLRFGKEFPVSLQFLSILLYEKNLKFCFAIFQTIFSSVREFVRVSYPAKTLQPSICVNVRHVRARGYACGT